MKKYLTLEECEAFDRMDFVSQMDVLRKAILDKPILFEYQPKIYQMAAYGGTNGISWVDEQMRAKISQAMSNERKEIESKNLQQKIKLANKDFDIDDDANILLEKPHPYELEPCCQKPHFFCQCEQD